MKCSNVERWKQRTTKRISKFNYIHMKLFFSLLHHKWIDMLMLPLLPISSNHLVWPKYESNASMWNKLVDGLRIAYWYMHLANRHMEFCMKTAQVVNQHCYPLSVEMKNNDNAKSIILMKLLNFSFWFRLLFIKIDRFNWVFHMKIIRPATTHTETCNFSFNEILLIHVFMK